MLYTCSRVNFVGGGYQFAVFLIKLVLFFHLFQFPFQVGDPAADFPPVDFQLGLAGSADAHAAGAAGLAAGPKDHAMLARLFWFTVEFGLVKCEEGVRAYGSGIMSSPSELRYAVESDKPQRKPFDAVDVLRTPYRIDILQPIYFVIDSFDDLFELAQADLLGYIKQARALGMHEPLFES